MRKFTLICTLLMATLSVAQTLPIPGPGKQGPGGGGGGTSNLGYTVVGASNAGGFVGYTFGNQFTTGSNGLGYAINSCSAYYTTKDGAADGWQCAIYADSAGVPGSKLCSSTTKSITSAAAWDTMTTNITGAGCGTLAASTTYWVFLEMQGNGTNMNYDGSTGAKYQNTGGYGTWNNPMGALGGDWGSTSLYITVTAN